MLSGIDLASRLLHHTIHVDSNGSTRRRTFRTARGILSAFDETKNTKRRDFDYATKTCHDRVSHAEKLRTLLIRATRTSPGKTSARNASRGIEEFTRVFRAADSEICADESVEPNVPPIGITTSLNTQRVDCGRKK